MKLIQKGILFTSLVFLPLSAIAGGDKAMGDNMDKKISKEYARDIPDHWISPSADQESASQKTVKKVQTELNNNGFNLDVDGVVGQRTKKALRTFQKELGLAATGRIDNDTLAALDVTTLEYDRSPASIDEVNPTDSSDSMPETDY